MDWQTRPQPKLRIASKIRNDDAKNTETVNRWRIGPKVLILTEWACSWVLRVLKSRLEIVKSMAGGYYFNDLASMMWSKKVVLKVERKESGLDGLSWGRGSGWGTSGKSENILVGITVTEMWKTTWHPIARH